MQRLGFWYLEFYRFRSENPHFLPNFAFAVRNTDPFFALNTRARVCATFRLRLQPLCAGGSSLLLFLCCASALSLPLISFPFLPLSSSFMCCARTKAPEHFVRQKVSLNQFWELFMRKFRLCRVCFSVGFLSLFQLLSCPFLSFPVFASLSFLFVLFLRPSDFSGLLFRRTVPVPVRRNNNPKK